MVGLEVVWITLGVMQGAARIICRVHRLCFAATPVFDCLTCFVHRASRGKSAFSRACS